MSQTQKLVSIGQAAVLLQALPDQIRATATELAIVPPMRLNQIDYYSEPDIQRIGAAIRTSIPSS